MGGFAQSSIAMVKKLVQYIAFLETSWMLV